jgi:hypothetical protein
MENNDNQVVQHARGRPDHSAKDTDHGEIANCLDSFYTTCVLVYITCDVYDVAS